VRLRHTPVLDARCHGHDGQAANDFSIDFRGQGKRFKQANQRLAYRNKINEKIWVTDPDTGY
jgi:hypothetical protein